MKSFKNHISLIIALFSILFSIQTFTIIQRSIDAYKQNLSDNYTIIVVSQKNMKKDDIKAIDSIINDVNELSAENIVKRLSGGMERKNVELLKLYLPKFYKLKLKYYPTDKELSKLRKSLLSNKYITKIEDFANAHDTAYKLLLLLKNIVVVFAVVVFIVTVLLILKELKIWQYMHNERMSIMALFGAATWLRSAVLFRLAIVDAFISTILTFGLFTYLSGSEFILKHFEYIGIDVIVFDKVYDTLTLLGVSMGIAIFLVILIILGHKEEI